MPRLLRRSSAKLPAVDPSDQDRLVERRRQRNLHCEVVRCRAAKWLKRETRGAFGERKDQDHRSAKREQEMVGSTQETGGLVKFKSDFWRIESRLEK